MSHGPDVYQDGEHCAQEGVHVALASGKCWKLLPKFGVKGLGGHERELLGNWVVTRLKW